MSKHYTDADLKAAAKSLAKERWSGFVAAQRREPITSPNERYARAVLDAVAPTIAARALREAAETWGLGMSATDHWRGSTVAAELRDRADEIEAGQS